MLAHLLAIKSIHSFIAVAPWPQNDCHSVQTLAFK